MGSILTNLHCTCTQLTCSNVKGSVTHGYRLTFAGQRTQDSSGLDLCATCEKNHYACKCPSNYEHCTCTSWYIVNHSITNPYLHWPSIEIDTTNFDRAFYNSFQNWFALGLSWTHLLDWAVRWARLSCLVSVESWLWREVAAAVSARQGSGSISRPACSAPYLNVDMSLCR